MSDEADKKTPQVIRADASQRVYAAADMPAEVLAALMDTPGDEWCAPYCSAHARLTAEVAALRAERDAAMEAAKVAIGSRVLAVCERAETERDAALAEAARLREALEVIAAQGSSDPFAASLVDSMAALARAALAGGGHGE